MNANENQTPNLLDHLMNVGYEPGTQTDSAAEGEMWFDLIASGIGTVRLVITLGEPEVYVFLFDGYMSEIWDVRLSNAPDAVIIATVKAAEWELAGMRGGPVTPAQAENAR